MTKLIPHIAIWAVLATIWVFVALYRRKLNLSVDDTIHVLDAEQSLIGTQADVAKKLAKTDLLGKILGVLVILYAAGMAAYYLYASFMDTSVKMN
ncbi:MAG: hypothetical protein ABSG25_12325 [Bryobacteraceae bacterium]